MSDADEFGLLGKRYVGPFVLKHDHACGLEARRGDAHEFIEDADVRAAFRTSA
jgi:hypothetical protein